MNYVSKPGKPSRPGQHLPPPTISGLPPCSRLSSPMRALGRIAARTAPGHARTATRRGRHQSFRVSRPVQASSARIAADRAV